jgi:predicted aspartyl protease
MSRTKGNHFVLSADVQNKKRTLCVDTGCTVTSLSPAVSKGLKTPEQLGIKLQDSVLEGIPGDEVVLIPELKFGNARFPNQYAVVQKLGLADDGLLGIDFLHRQFALFDCADAKLYVRSKPPPEESTAALERTLIKNGFICVPLKETKALVMTCEAEINGNKVTLLVDTGGVFTLLDDKTATRCGLRWEQTDITVGGITRIGRTRIWSATPDSFKLAGHRINLRGLAIGGAEMKNWDIGNRTNLEEVHGVLGADLLTVCLSLIDIPGKKLWILPDPAPPPGG